MLTRDEPPATLLEAEMRRRHWTREDTLTEMSRTARDMGLRGYTLGLRQLDRWLTGQVGNPRGAACRVAERLFGRPIEILLGPPEAPNVAPPGQPGTARIDRLTTYAATTARDHARLYAGSIVDPVSVETLHMDVRRLARGYATMAPLDLLAQLVAARDRAYELLERTRRPGEVADLFLIAGQLCGLAATTSWDLGDPEAADDLAGAAWTYGQICGHDTLRAWVRSVQATIAFWSGRPGEGLRFVSDGLQYAHGAAAARLHAIGARAWSLMPNPDQAIAALRRSLDARDHDSGYDDMTDGIGGEFAFSPARLALCSGAVYLALGDGPSGARCATETLQLYEQTPVEQRRWAVQHGALIDLATARAYQGDPDGAADAVAPSLQLEPERRTARLGRRMQTLRTVVTKAPYRSTAVARDLTEAVDDWTAVALSGSRPLALPAAD